MDRAWSNQTLLKVSMTNDNGGGTDDLDRPCPIQALLCVCDPSHPGLTTVLQQGIPCWQLPKGLVWGRGQRWLEQTPPACLHCTSVLGARRKPGHNGNKQCRVVISFPKKTKSNPGYSMAAVLKFTCRLVTSIPLNSLIFQTGRVQHIQWAHLVSGHCQKCAQHTSRTLGKRD